MGELQNMSAKELLAYYSAKSYEDARTAKKEGRLVCWSASVAPDEFCVAMDICMVYPENHAAAIGAKKGSLPLLEIAESKGYSTDCCSYARVNLGYLELLKEYHETGEIPELLRDCPGELCPLPDLIITCNNLCNTLLKWYENLAAELNIPCLFLDTPYNHEDEVNQRSRTYMKAQLEDMIHRLEQICGRPFDYDRFLQVQQQSQRSIAAWDRMTSMVCHKPSPMNGFDFFNYMALVVCYRAQKGSEECFNKCADEMQKKLEDGIYAFGENELYRFSWEGIACWPYLSHTFKAFKKLGMLMTGSGYPDMWSLHYTPGDLEDMGRAYSSIITNRSAVVKAEMTRSVMEKGQCDGMVYHVNRSCKIMSFLAVETTEQVERETGKPFVMFDGDQTDPRSFAAAQFDTRVQTLQEVMQQHREEA